MHTNNADPYQLERFISAQQHVYAQALSEIINGRKTSHWMWFIFPQPKGLGYSSTSKFYAIENDEEAKLYLQHPVLGARLREITHATVSLNTTNLQQIFGYPDHLKFMSCMQLFVKHEFIIENVFMKAIDKFS